MQYFSQGHRLGHRLRSSQLKPELWVLRCSTTPCHLCSDSPGSLPPACIYSTSLPGSSFSDWPRSSPMPEPREAPQPPPATLGHHDHTDCFP